MPHDRVPTLYEWLGGGDALNRLTSRFYQHVRPDPLLGAVFAHMGEDHPAHVAAFLGEVLGGPPVYSEAHGGHAGSRLAVINSQPGTTVDPGQPMPKWGWGEVKGPYRP